MFGLSETSFLLLAAAVTIVGRIVLIARFKAYPFIALILAAGFFGFATYLPPVVLMR